MAQGDRPLSRADSDRAGDPVDLHDGDLSARREPTLMQVGEQHRRLPLRHLELGCNVPMYRTNIACRPAGIFRGPMVVSMRPMTPAQAIRAIQICARFPLARTDR